MLSGGPRVPVWSCKFLVHSQGDITAGIISCEGTLFLALSPVRGHYSWIILGADTATDVPALFGFSGGKGRSALQPLLGLLCPSATEITLSLLGKSVCTASNSCFSPGGLSIPVRMGVVAGHLRIGCP